MLAGTRNPTPHGVFWHLEDSRRGLVTEAFGDGVQDLGDAGWKSFQVIEGCMASRREFTSTGLTIKILDWFVSTVMPVADQGMDSGVGIVEVTATLVRAGKTSCADGFLATSRTLYLTIRNQRDDGGWRRRSGRYSAQGAVVWSVRP